MLSAERNQAVHSIHEDSSEPRNTIARMKSYGLSNQEAHEYVLGCDYLKEPQEEHRMSRRAFSVFAIGTVGALLGGSALAKSLGESADLPTPSDALPKMIREGEAIGEFKNSFYEHGRAYVLYDELTDTVAETGNTINLFVEGSDALQSYTLRPKTYREASGLENVHKDGFNYLRFTFRPTEQPQFICTTTTTQEGETKKTEQQIPSFLTRYPGDGTIPLYLETQLTAIGHVNELHRHYNALGFLFPDNPPFLTLRDTLDDEVTSTIQAENKWDIPIEITLSSEAISAAYEDETLLTHFNNLTDIYIIGIQLDPENNAYESLQRAYGVISTSQSTLDGDQQIGISD